jgi:hypothetical protein
MLHVVLYCLLPIVPGLVLLPLRFLDREPSNELTQEQDGDERDPGPLAAAA